MARFRVITRNYDRQFDRWTEALDAANALKLQCKSWLQDVRILEGDDLIWVYSRLHAYPQYIGAGTYNRLARLFLEEASEESIHEATDS